VQIFHAAFLVGPDGERPDPYTLVSSADVESGRWQVDADAATALGRDPEQLRRHLLHYVHALAAGGKYELTVWPYHAMLGGIGHALASSVEEAIFFHGIARSSQPKWEVKGDDALTEHYSMLGPEVTTDADGQPIGDRNDHLVAELLEYDAVVVAGQAKSHCVAWTIDDLLRGVAARDPQLAAKVYLLEDCSSPVVVPGVVDYTDDADHAFRRFQEAGMHVVRSTDPIEAWPDLRAVVS
jgi:nicotinamidase-related amidase